MEILIASADNDILTKIYPALKIKVHANFKIAQTAQDCKRLIQEGYHPNYVICDYHLPPGNGIDVIMMVRSKAELDVTKILLMIEPQDSQKAAAMVSMLKADMKEKPVGLYDIIRFLGGLQAPPM